MSEETGYRIIQSLLIAITMVCFPGFIYIVAVENQITEHAHLLAIINMSVFTKCTLGINLYENNKRNLKIHPSGQKVIAYSLFRFF
ncbi:hypothetical protein NBRC116595_36950 [Aliiglaciecola sp. NS0011-25]